MTTCPRCAQLIQFQSIELINESIECKSCGVGKDAAEKSREVYAPDFIDPIESGIFNKGTYNTTKVVTDSL